MAENWIISQEIDLQRGVQAPQVWANALIVCGDSKAHTWRVTIMDGGKPANLSGIVTGYFVRGDNATVKVSGTLTGNVASVTLDESCYNVEGDIVAVMRIRTSAGRITLAALIFSVRRIITDTIVDPENVIPSLDDLLAQIERMESSIQAADTATATANAAATNANAAAAAANAAAEEAWMSSTTADEAAERAEAAAEVVEGLTVSGHDVAYDQPATAIVTNVDGHKHISFGLRQGIPGDVPTITFAVKTGEPGTDVQVEQSGAPDAPTVTLTIPRGKPGEGAVSSVDGLMPGSDGDVALDAVRYVSQTLENAQKQQARTNIGAQASLVHNYTYDGQDLSQMFTAAELHQKVSSGDFSGIQNGDYWPIMLTGNFKDYATGQTKTLNNAVFKLEANINVYINYGDTPVANHILFCSRDLIPIALQMRSEDRTWYDDAQTNPWLGSALYQTLNASDGVFPLVAATDIGAYMYVGPNGNGMRFLLETKGLDATTATGWEWGDRGKLFLPIEREVWGQDVWSEHLWGGGAAVQWPVFAGSLKHISKGLGNGGSRCDWWCQSSCAGRADNFACANGGGVPYYRGAATVGTGAPLCFLFV